MAAGRRSAWFRGCWLFGCVVAPLTAVLGDAGGVYHQLEYDFAEERPAGSIVGSIRTDARLGLDRLDAGVLSTVRFTQRRGPSPLCPRTQTADTEDPVRYDRGLSPLRPRTQSTDTEDPVR